VDTVAWGALTLTLTALGAAWTAYAFRKRGVASGVRGLGITLVPLGLLLTNSLRMVTRVVDAVGSWLGGLAWNPLTWIGLIVLGMSAVCFVVSGVIRDRQLANGTGDARAAGSDDAPSPRRSLPRSEPTAPAAGAAPVDDDLADIEAILRKRGIS
jgi:hypothetical protein